MIQNNNWQWYMSKPNFFTNDECDELVERIKNTEKSEQGCLDDHFGDDHNTDFRNVTEWYLHKDMRDYVVGDYSSLNRIYLLRLRCVIIYLGIFIYKNQKII